MQLRWMMGVQSACRFFRLIFSSVERESETNTTLVWFCSANQVRARVIALISVAMLESVRSVAEEFSETILPLTLTEYAEPD